MSTAVDKYWQLVQCYKGFLPAKEAAAALSYVVLACRRHSKNSSRDDNDDDDDTSASSHHHHHHHHHHHIDATTCTCADAAPLPQQQPQMDAMKVATNDGNNSNNGQRHDDEDTSRQPTTTHVTTNNKDDAVTDTTPLAYYIYRKCDVSPPPLKCILSPKKIAHCFVACTATHCACDAPHVRRGAWRLRVDTLVLPHASMLVCERGRNRRVLAEQLVPTAGLYFALGLLQLHAVQAVMPVLCRYGALCKHGSDCLYVHIHTAAATAATTTMSATAVTQPVVAPSPVTTVQQQGEVLQPPSHLPATTTATTAATTTATHVDANDTTALSTAGTTTAAAAATPPLTATQPAATLLRQWDARTCAEVLPEATERAAFFDYMEAQGLVTVGDVQELGVMAFELLAGRVPARWAQAFLAMTVFRTLDRKAALQDTLLRFPHVRAAALATLPPSLHTVGDVLRLSAAQFYSLELPPHVMDACEALRSRCEVDEEYAVVALAQQPPLSFYVRVTDIVVGFRAAHAHCSWRKHDAARPVVTSLFTYVDVTQCRCHGYGERDGLLDAAAAAAATATTVVDAGSHCNGNDSDCNGHVHCTDGHEVVPCDVVNGVGSPTRAGIGTPPQAWCTCERRWVIAVNYELSTPSGSRCSEQNAMGKLASSGVPTWAVREVFVHGHDTRKEVNPLFPCGVCENMLQKVTRDVYARYGGGVTLYMFDAREPRKLVYLPMAEMSHRAGTSFRRFVEHDLRAE